MAAKRVPLSEMIARKTEGLRSGKPADKAEAAEEEAEGEYSEDGMTACEDMMDAIKSRDAKGLDTALRHWMEMHKG